MVLHSVFSIPTHNVKAQGFQGAQRSEIPSLPAEVDSVIAVSGWTGEHLYDHLSVLPEKLYRMHSCNIRKE